MSASVTDRRGAAWIIGSFVFCPCHLPLTLGIGAALLSGTALGAWWSGHPYIVGTIVTALWIAGTWRGFHYLRSAPVGCPVKPDATTEERATS